MSGVQLPTLPTFISSGMNLLTVKLRIEAPGFYQYKLPQGPHYLTIMKPPLNLPLKVAEWQETSVNAFV